MGASRRPPDVLVVGGGVIGCALALELARRGAAVEVVEAGAPGEGATRAAGGMLSPLSEAGGPGPFLALALTSLDSYPVFVQEVEAASGFSVGFQAPGKLEVALDDSEAEELKASLRWRLQADPDATWLEPGEVLALEPCLTPDTRGAVRLDRDRTVDSRALGRALWLAAEAAGVRFVLGERVTEVVAAGGRAVGVRTAAGAVRSAGHTVLAAGCWSGEVRGLPAPLPVFPVRGQMLSAVAVPPALRHVVHTRGCYVVPRSGGELLVGATSERSGFRSETTLGGIGALLSAATRAAPVLASARLTGHWAGLRPCTPDQLPILGPDPELPGLWYATGHFRNGILLAPITALVLADGILGAREAGPAASAPQLEPFSVARFGKRTDAG